MTKKQREINQLTSKGMSRKEAELVVSESMRTEAESIALAMKEAHDGTGI